MVRQKGIEPSLLAESRLEVCRVYQFRHWRITAPLDHDSENQSMDVDEITQFNQSDKFEAFARELEADEDEARCNERLAKVAAHRPAPEPEKPE